MLKNFVKKVFNSLGYDINRIDKSINRLSFDDIHKLKIKKTNPMIFDVGANVGQSIERFRGIFPNSTIHSFEPSVSAYDELKKNFYNLNNVFLNNIGIGEKNTKRNFYSAAKSETSSFIKISNNTKWIKTRSKEFNTSIQDYSKVIDETPVESIDNYCRKNSIDYIDILKIDTQGYEEKVLIGTQNFLKNNKISIIETELILDDVYEEHVSFFQIEKYLITNNYRLVAVKPMIYNNLYEGNIFVVDLIYTLNK